MSRRTSRVIRSKEGKVLRYLRNRHGLSMRRAGELIGISDSYISQIENGRENPPNRKRLESFLAVYGGIGTKYFFELCREWEERETDEEVVRDLLPKLRESQLKAVRTLVEQYLKT
jgi:transcriptional regulator with XRE-family HTH domain